jgi:hypothetical protein
MKPSNSLTKDIPLKIAGSNKFGRYPKISCEQTFNMILSDGWLVPYAGYKVVNRLITNGAGRAIYSSPRALKMIVVIDNKVYSINSNLSESVVGLIDTYTGDVFIDENNNTQIAICDKQSIYIYDWQTGDFAKSTLPNGDPLDFKPGYITYQNGRFVSVDLSTDVGANWRLSEVGNGLHFPNTSQFVGTLQTKGDTPVAALRVPGNGNLLFLFGKTVVEPWNDLGLQLFPYQKNTSTNIDYGCANSSTIAAKRNIVAWLGINEKSGAAILYTMGGEVNRLSNDGIDFLFAHLRNPSNSYGFFFEQDGHLIYQISFLDPEDNFTFIYDFTTKAFFTPTDENMGAHIAKRIAFFNNKYYFVSTIDGHLYEMGSNLTTYDYGDGNIKEIPRVRVCEHARLPDSSPFIGRAMTFTMEQGCDSLNIGDASYRPRVDASLSYDGGETFSSYVPSQMNVIGKRKNRVVWNGLGQSNDLVQQFRFWGKGRFLATDGVLSVYQ